MTRSMDEGTAVEVIHLSFSNDFKKTSQSIFAWTLWSRWVDYQMVKKYFVVKHGVADKGFLQKSLNYFAV